MDKVQLLQVVECPACQAGLTDWKACRACGITFDADGDTPRLMAKNATRLVSFDFAATRSVVPDERQVELLRYPPRSPKKKAPYHLDAAHAQVLEGLEPGKTILDIGCGGGQMRTYVEGLGHEYVGIDISKTRVHEWLQEHGGPDLLADAHFLPFKSATFDVIYSAAVTEHLACPQLVAQQIHRAL
ncbi:MAG: class I SAM-dependent methyltransferase, partial [Planctomycetota bacterium]